MNRVLLTSSLGKWRRIRVVAGQGGGQTRYVTRTRTGYYVPKGE